MAIAAPIMYMMVQNPVEIVLNGPHDHILLAANPETPGANAATSETRTRLFSCRMAAMSATMFG